MKYNVIIWRSLEKLFKFVMDYVGTQNSVIICIRNFGLERHYNSHLED
jgi:hypothetical protein